MLAALDMMRRHAFCHASFVFKGPSALATCKNMTGFLLMTVSAKLMQVQQGGKAVLSSQASFTASRHSAARAMA